MTMIIGMMLLGLACVVMAVQAIRNARRRRWRAERRERHARIARDWAVMRTTFGPRNKRLTYEGAEVEAD